MQAPLQLDRRLTVSGGHLKHTLVLSTVLEEGREYMKVGKKDCKIARLLCDEYAAESRPLSKTDILESLVQLRDARYEELAEEPTEAGKENLGIDKRKARRKPPQKALPTSIVIQTPTIGDVAGIAMAVLLDHPGATLSMEVSTTNIAYLTAVVKNQ